MEKKEDEKVKEPTIDELIEKASLAIEGIKKATFEESE